MQFSFWFSILQPLRQLFNILLAANHIGVLIMLPHFPKA